MYRHIVMIGFKEKATDEQKQACLDGLKRLGEIPDVKQVLVEPNDGRDQTFTDVLIIDCEDKEAFGRYSAHPLHKEVLDKYYFPAVGSRAMANISF